MEKEKFLANKRDEPTEAGFLMAKRKERKSGAFFARGNLLCFEIKTELGKKDIRHFEI
jgi:hypothetical protein